MTTRSAIFKHAEKKYGTQPDYPFHHFQKYAALRHDSDGKWYGLIMNASREKLGIAGSGEIEVLDVKCKPEDIERLHKQAGVIPAYHMNKEHWISILLDGSMSADSIWDLLDASFKLTK